MSELKPCPFCGGVGRTTDRYDRWVRDTLYRVECEGCEALAGEFQDRENAELAWNTRTPAPVVQAGEAVPVAWRWRASGEATWEYFGREPIVRDGSAYQVEPLFASPSPREEEMRREIEGLRALLERIAPAEMSKSWLPTPLWQEVRAALDKDSSHE